MNMQIIAISALSLSTAIIISMIILAITWVKVTGIKMDYQERSSQQKYYLATMPLDIDSVNILDKIITDVFNRYQIMNLAHRDNLYVTTELQKKIIRDVLTVVYLSLSDDLLNKLTLIYKKDYIEDIIVQKIQFLVMNYTISTNNGSDSA